jgi:hypothetical protein
MSNAFDASFICNEPLTADVLAEQQKTVEHWLTMPSALANAKLHAERELGRLVSACNRIAWGGLPPEQGKPNGQETSALLQRLGAEEREKLMRDSRLAAEQRHLLALIEEGEASWREQQRAEQEQLAQYEAEQEELAEFEAYDAAGKQARFEAWRAARRGARTG